MRKDEPLLHSLANAIQGLCARPQTPLTVAEQQRRYRPRKKLPDWAWAIIVGMIVSGIVVGIMLAGAGWFSK